MREGKMQGTGRVNDERCGSTWVLLPRVRFREAGFGVSVATMLMRLTRCFCEDPTLLEVDLGSHRPSWVEE